MKKIFLLLLVILFSISCTNNSKYELIIRNGLVCDGTGSASYMGDLAINGDTIAAMGNLKNAHGTTEIDAGGKAIAPGFINMLSWADKSLIEDGLSQSDIRQGVTLEVMGEGWSDGPLNEAMKKDEFAKQGDIKYDITWNTLGGYLDFLEKKGVSTNIASFVGATTLRIYAIGYDNRPPLPEEMTIMKKLAGQAMEEGAIGISSALIYAPASFSKTDELVELCKVVSKYNGMYISHIRSEGDNLLASLDELIEISKNAHIKAEIYHLKAAGTKNWYKMDLAINKIDSARIAGMDITANMYTYTAAGTGLYATMPQWVQEGGPWVSFGSDEQSLAPEGVFLKSNPHPRAYGNVSRLLGKYTREEKIIPLVEAVRKLTSLPAVNMKISKRGLLKTGYFADVVIFDPNTIIDHATYSNPHQYSTGISDVFVNGKQVLRNGEHTGAKPGRVVRGPGYKTGKPNGN
jgi:N-acyl-D-aspartate/D-glutamate deacylase